MLMECIKLGVHSYLAGKLVHVPCTGLRVSQTYRASAPLQGTYGRSQDLALKPHPNPCPCPSWPYMVHL